MITLFRRVREKFIGEGNVRRYMLYAIGEILLVVIGILIALQVNNWNEERRSNLQSEDLKSSILVDLQQDLDLIEASLESLKIRVSMFDSLQIHLNHPDVTEQEVVHMIQNEFTPFIFVFPGFNDGTYRSASSSGALSVLNQEEKEMLYDLYLAQSEATRTFNKYEDIYLERASDLIGPYPLKLPFVTFNSGPVYERKWSEYDFSDLTSKFNIAGSSQRNYYRILFNVLINIQGQTVETIEYINNSQ